MEEMLEQVTALSAVCLGRVESVVNMGLVFFGTEWQMNYTTNRLVEHIKNHVSVGFESGVCNKCLDIQVFIAHSDLCEIGLAGTSFKGEIPQSMGWQPRKQRNLPGACFLLRPLRVPRKCTDFFLSHFFFMKREKLLVPRPL